MVEGAGAQPLISIIITNFNYADFVGVAIGSALDQDYPHIECIVVDDGSSDGSRRVIDGFAGIVPVFQANSGQAGAAMTGLARAKGEIVLFLDADDRLERTACSRIAAAYAPDIALYQFRLEKRDLSGAALGVLPEEPFLTGGHRNVLLRHGSFPSAPTSGNAFAAAHCRKMFAKITAADQRRFFDGFLLFSAPFSGRVVALDMVLGSYLVHGRNVSFPAMTRRALRHNLDNALWQRTAIALGAGGPADIEAAARHLSPYHLRNAMILRRIEDDSRVSGGRLFALFGALLRKSAGFPGLSLYRRARLVGTGLFVLLAPRALLAAMAPEDRA